MDNLSNSHLPTRAAAVRITRPATNANRRHSENASPKASNHNVHHMPETAFQPDADLLHTLELLILEGRPYNLEDHFPMRELFGAYVPPRIVLKCARKVSKTTTICAAHALRACATPFLKTLFILPREQQANRVSVEFLQPFLNNSPIGKRRTDRTCSIGVRRRTLNNGANFEFLYAYQSAERIRSAAPDVIQFDEWQSINPDFLPIILPCKDASRWGFVGFAGTPLSLDNGMETVWQESSKGEWVIPCGCGHHHLCTIHEDLEKMVQRTGLFCTRCQARLNPRIGHWRHEQPAVAGTMGLHVPQHIMPMHVEIPDKWDGLIGRLEGRDGFSRTRYLNEVCGESTDTSVTLTSLADIKAACRSWSCDYNAALNELRKFPVTAMGIDWSGGGADETSTSVVTMCGLDTATGRVSCRWCYRFPFGSSHSAEANRILEIFRDLNPAFLVHDAGGAGSLRETLLIQAGVPISRIMAAQYVYAPLRKIFYPDREPGQPRVVWHADKSRTLGFQSQAIKAGFIEFPAYDTCGGVLDDVINLYEEIREGFGGPNRYVIRRKSGKTDDFSAALNLCCLALWESSHKYPNLTLLHADSEYENT